MVICLLPNSSVDNNVTEVVPVVAQLRRALRHARHRHRGGCARRGGAGDPPGRRQRLEAQRALQLRHPAAGVNLGHYFELEI
jgi:hypothetical protein